MRSLWAAILLMGCTTTADGVDTVTSSVEVREVPLVTQAKLDVVLVIDNSPAMASQRQRVIDGLSAAATAADLSTVDVAVTVVTSDGQVRGSLSSRARAESPLEQSFDGDFATELAALADVGATGENHAFDSMTAALASVSGDGRSPYLVFVLATDDASTSPIPSHLPEDLIATAVMPRGLPRMEQLLGRISREQRIDLDDAFGTLLNLVPVEFPLVGEPCFDEVPLSTCSVSYRWASGEQLVPECVRDPLARPCWSMETAPAGQCVFPAQIHLHHANPDWFWMAADPELPTGAHLVEQCVVDR